MRQKSSLCAFGLITLLAACPAQASELFAAIAFSPSSGKVGSAWNFDTAVLAETEAFLQCGLNDCYAAVIFHQCGAIAVGEGYGMGYGLDQSLAKATELALGSCAEFTTNCQITEAFCNAGF
jgi:hypothetical protein